jgi:hypothetical protein
MPCSTCMPIGADAVAGQLSLASELQPWCQLNRAISRPGDAPRTFQPSAAIGVTSHSNRIPIARPAVSTDDGQYQLIGLLCMFAREHL